MIVSNHLYSALSIIVPNPREPQVDIRRANITRHDSSNFLRIINMAKGRVPEFRGERTAPERGLGDLTPMLLCHEACP